MRLERYLLLALVPQGIWDLQVKIPAEYANKSQETCWEISLYPSACNLKGRMGTTIICSVSRVSEVDVHNTAYPSQLQPRRLFVSSDDEIGCRSAYYQ
jgi:hypothetical protein